MDIEQDPGSRDADISKRTTVRELRQQLDQRDETIRLLNEALSRALDELARGGKLAA